MDKESITIKIEARIFHKSNSLQDCREFTVQSTRAEVAKKLDEICADIDRSFEQ